MLIHSNPHLFHSSLEAGVSGLLSLSIKFTASCSWEMVVTWSHRVEAMTGVPEKPYKGMKETLLSSFLQQTHFASWEDGSVRLQSLSPFLRHRVACSGWSPSYVHSTKSVFTLPSALYLPNLCSHFFFFFDFFFCPPAVIAINYWEGSEADLCLLCATFMVIKKPITVVPAKDYCSILQMR